MPLRFHAARLPSSSRRFRHLLRHYATPSFSPLSAFRAFGRRQLPLMTCYAFQLIFIIFSY
jgi:hypothetical protein